MQNAYIVARKTGKKACFSAKTVKIHKKIPVFGEKRAKLAIFMQFWRWNGLIFQNSQKSPFLANSLLELFEFYSNRGRVIICFKFFWTSQTSPENKKPLPMRWAAVLKL